MEVWKSRALWLVLFAAFAHSVWAASLGWWNPILDEHSFRQAQTAVTIQYLLQGGPFFAYETPLLGAPWSIPFELPVYQWIVAKLTPISGMPLEQCGRLVGRLFFYLLLWPLNEILAHFGVKKEGRLFTLALYLMSPLYLFWSRCILIESTVIFFSAAYFAASLRAFKERSSVVWILAAAFFGIFAGTIKVTTAFTFFLLSGFAFLYYARASLHDRKEWPRRALEVLGAFVIPGIATMAWLKFSDQVKAQNPLAEFILSKSLTEWNFGTLEQRVSPKIWYMFFRKTIHDAIGHRTTWMISIAFLPFIAKKYRWLAGLALVAFLVGPMTFTNLHIAHNYYWMANGVFLVLYMGFVLDGLFQAPKAWMRHAGMALAIATLLLSYRQFHGFAMHWQLSNNPVFFEMEKPVAEIVGPQDAVLIFNNDWYPAAPYAIKRRSVMIRNDAAIGSPKFIRALELVKEDKRSIRGILQCGSWSGMEKEQLQKFLPFDAKIYFKGSCELYKVL